MAQSERIAIIHNIININGTRAYRHGKDDGLRYGDKKHGRYLKTLFELLTR